jgi:hypothetical protein
LSSVSRPVRARRRRSETALARSISACPTARLTARQTGARTWPPTLGQTGEKSYLLAPYTHYGMRDLATDVQFALVVDHTLP